MRGTKEELNCLDVPEETAPISCSVLHTINPPELDERMRGPGMVPTYARLATTVEVIPVRCLFDCCLLLRALSRWDWARRCWFLLFFAISNQRVLSVPSNGRKDLQ